MQTTFRFLVIILFSTSAFILLYAFIRRPLTYHLLGIIVWCVHVIVFTTVAMLRAQGIIDIIPDYLNIWSNIVRLHGGIVALTVGLYYIGRKDLLK